MNLLVVPQEILEFRDLKVNKYNMKEKGFWVTTCSWTNRCVFLLTLLTETISNSVTHSPLVSSLRLEPTRITSKWSVRSTPVAWLPRPPLQSALRCSLFHWVRHWVTRTRTYTRTHMHASARTRRFSVHVAIYYCKCHLLLREFACTAFVLNTPCSYNWLYPPSTALSSAFSPATSIKACTEPCGRCCFKATE